MPERNQGVVPVIVKIQIVLAIIADVRYICVYVKYEQIIITNIIL